MTTPFKSSARIERLKDSQQPFFYEPPGFMSGVFTPILVSHCCTVMRQEDSRSGDCSLRQDLVQ